MWRGNKKLYCLVSIEFVLLKERLRIILVIWLHLVDNTVFSISLLILRSRELKAFTNDAQ